MAASLPSPASSPNSPASSDSPQSPSANPVQTLALPPPVDASPQAPPANSPPAQPKRKPSRRANTAERRATHNAVERARRETLNGRFLDLAALLPNLSQIRRPSKSSIVNSSIAHIHASRRHRLLAARELRLLKLETDALRRELNEWRDRSGLPRVEEPVRGEAFQMILSGEVEVVNPGPIEEDDGGDYGADDYADDDFAQPPMIPSSAARDSVNEVLARAPDVTPFAHNIANNNGALHLQTIMSRPPNHGPAPSPMIVQSPTGISFENPAMASIYEPNPMQLNNPSYFMNSHGAVVQRPAQSDADKVSAWNAQMYGIATQQQPQQQQFSPPTSSHGANGSSPINVPSPQQAAYLMSLHRQQAMLPPSGPMGLAGHGHVYGSPIDGDDSSSVGSSPGNNNARRERSGSMNSVGSGYASGAGGSPSGTSMSGGFDLPGMINSSAGGVPRRMGSGMGMGQWDDAMTGMAAAGGMGGMGGMGGLMKSTQPISVGGGGNGHGFAAMMM